MPISTLTILTIIILPLGALSSSPERHQESASTRTQEATTLDLTLSSGLQARGIVYRRERLGGNWILQIKSDSGTNFILQDGAPKKSLNQSEFIELINSALTNIHELHSGRLNHIQIDVDLIDSFWSEALAHLRTLPIPLDEEVVQQSPSISDGLIEYISGSSVVEAICSQTLKLRLECNEQPISMNPVAFQPQHLGKRWSHVRNLSNAGIQSSELWYSIDLKTAEQR